MTNNQKANSVSVSSVKQDIKIQQKTNIFNTQFFKRILLIITIIGGISIFTLIRLNILPISLNFTNNCFFCSYSSYAPVVAENNETVANSDCSSSLFKQIFSLGNTFRADNISYDMYNTLIILPDKQKAFLNYSPYGKEIKIASANDEKSNYCVFPEYRIENHNETPCFIVYPTKEGIPVENKPTQRYYNSPSECIKAV